MSEPEKVTVVGAGPAGLAVAACLAEKKIPAQLFDAASEVGSAWRNHYQRLHLHTHKGGSSLPGFPLPADYPRYPSRQQVVDYLEAYAKHFELEVHLEEPVTRVERAGDSWKVTTAKQTVTSKQVVVATGYTRVPQEPRWAGMEHFRGEVLHSSRYRNGAPWKGKRVLVVGLGNSGGEIAIDLHEHGALPTVSVRSPVNVIPREAFGIPILTLAAMMRPFPVKVGDALTEPLLAVTVGDIRKVGLRRNPYGAMEQITRRASVPLIDVGTIALMREGKIKVQPGVERFTETSVVFVDGTEEPFAAVVLATGYRPGLEAFLAESAEVSDGKGTPRGSGKQLPGLYLCGFEVSTQGMLKAIGLEAREIATDIAAVRS